MEAAFLKYCVQSDRRVQLTTEGFGPPLCIVLIPLCSMVLETDAPYFLPYYTLTTLEFSDPQMVLGVAQEVATCHSG